MTSLAHSFTEIASLIQQSRNNALRAVNAELVNLYWKVGAYISQKLQHSEWGDKTVSELAKFLKANHPELKGFEKSNLHRMVKFYEAYANETFVPQLVDTVCPQLECLEQTEIVDTVRPLLENEIIASVGQQFVPMDITKTILSRLSWSHHRTIFSRCKMDVKRENEDPSIGILLCKDKDNEVVEYALNRNLSPAMVAEYQVLLPQKELLQRKLQELEI